MNKLAVAERFHWTLDYIESLDIRDYWALLARLDGLNRARDYLGQRGR